MSFLIPESIETPRLRLRTVTDEDWFALHEYYGDAQSVKYTTLQPSTEEDSRHMKKRRRPCWGL